MAISGSIPAFWPSPRSLREAEPQTLASGDLGRFVALDADAESLRDIDRHYAHLGVETVHASVRHFLMKKIKLGTFDFVYAAGLYDYLCESTAQALSARLFEMVNPGGQMLIPNFAPQLRDRAYMETFMDWTLIYRDQPDMVRLLDKIERAQIRATTYTTSADLSLPSGQKRSQVC
jgi:cyclopropane fatty-acyl-phospholipid synthase-like methyltransferase